MNQSIDGTISPASSSRASACSACRSRSAILPSTTSGGAGGGSGNGTKAATSSPPTVVRSYLPVVRCVMVVGYAFRPGLPKARIRT